jgi:hypothetical protein
LQHWIVALQHDTLSCNMVQQLAALHSRLQHHLPRPNNQARRYQRHAGYNGGMGWHLLYERVRMAAPALLLLRGGSDGYELRSRYIGAPMDHSCAACADSQREPK